MPQSARNIRFGTCMQLLRWKAPDVAEQLGCAPALVQRWAGRGPRPLEPPEAVMEWLEELAQAIRRYPPPPAVEWRSRA